MNDIVTKKKQTNKQTNKQKKRIGKLKQTIAVKKEKTLPTAVVKDNTAEEEEEATGENDTSANGPVCSFCEKQTEEDVVYLTSTMIRAPTSSMWGAFNQSLRNTRSKTKNTG